MKNPINKTAEQFNESLKALGKSVGGAKIEYLALLVCMAMEGENRVFHTVEHVLNVCQGMNPTQTLAGLFHDVVYYQLDGGYSKGIEDILDGAIRPEDGKFRVDIKSSYSHYPAICADIFGFEDGQKISLFEGANEFTSAIVAANCLGPILTEQELVAVIACIEATIPFRGGQPCQTLFQRIKKHFDSFTESTVDQIVTDAVILANNDLKGFSENNADQFLLNTCLLINESRNPVSNSSQTLRSYRESLFRNQLFLAKLTPEKIFARYKNTPSESRYNDMIMAAKSNICIANRYLGIRLLTIGIIEAIAMKNGGDCKASVLLGQIRQVKQSNEKIEDKLPPPPDDRTTNAQVLGLLENGVRSNLAENFVKSPLAAYIYRTIGDPEISDLIDASVSYFANELNHDEFLGKIPPDLRNKLVAGCAEMSLISQDARSKPRPHQATRNN